MVAVIPDSKYQVKRDKHRIVRMGILVVMCLLLAGIAAGETITPLKAGTVVSTDSKVIVDKDTITFGDLDNKLYITTAMRQDGVAINPVERIQAGDTSPIGMKEVSLNPTAETDFQFIDGKRLKETIVIYKYADLTFPVSLAPDTEIVRIGQEYRIVEKGAYDPSNWQYGGIPKSIIIEKPYGTDANGRHVDMDYTYDGISLHLVFNDEVLISTEKGGVEKMPIAYPLTIDPTYLLSNYQSYLVASLKFNTSTLTYDSIGSVTWTNHGLTQNTSVKKFGDSSATAGLAPHSNYLYGNSQTATVFGTGSFTIAGWIYSTNATGDGVIYDGRTSGGGAIPTIGLASSGKIIYIANSATKITSPGGAVPINQWNQFALIRNATNSVTTLYVNGTSMGTYTSDTTTYAQGATSAPFIGNSYLMNPTNGFYGNLDDIAVWKGVAIGINELYPQYYGVGERTLGLDDSYTVSLLHFDGTNGGTVFTDESGKAWSISGSPTTTTGSYVFAPAAGNFTSGSITTPQVSDFNVGSGDFTIDFWYNQRGQNFPTTMTLFRGNTSGTLAGVLLYLTPNALTAFASEEGGTNGNWNVLPGLGMGSVPADGWNHFALVRNGTTFYSFKNGSLVGTATSSKTISGAASTALVSLGGTKSNATIDEFRITKGLARWTSAFTPPTYAYATTIPTFTKTLMSTGYSYPVVYNFNSTTLDAGWTGISCNWTMTSTGSTYYYDGCDQSVSFGSAGTKTMKLTTNNTNTSAESPVQSWVIGVPNSDFFASPTTGTAALLVQFNSTPQNLTPIVSYNWSFGDGYYSDVANPQHVYGSWGVFDVNLTVSSVEGSDSEVKTSYIVTSTAQDVPADRPLYVHETKFVFLDMTGEPIGSLPVTIQMMNSTIDDTNWYSTLYNIPSSATALNGTMLSGMTDSFGSITFVVSSIGLYELNAVDASRGISWSKTIMPSATDYVFSIPTSDHPAIQVTPTTGLIGYTITNATVDATTEKINMTYQDLSSGTSNVTFYVRNASGYLLHSQVFTSPGTTLCSYSQDITHSTGGDSLKFGFEAVQSTLGNIGDFQTLTFYNNVPLSGTTIGWPEQWIGISLLIVLAAVFSMISTKLGAVIIPLFAGFETYVLGWLQPSVGMGAMATTIGILLVYGVMTYMRRQADKVT